MAKPRTTHAAAHDHHVCIERALSTATELCAARGLNLTPVRRRVLELVWRAHAPIGAYDILAELAKERQKAAPPTVYRALEFLMNAGLVHRIDSLNAFLGCDTPQRAHVAQFLVCRGCQQVVEIDDPAINRVLADKSRAAGFRIEPTALEIKGLCAECGSARDQQDPGEQQRRSEQLRGTDRLLREPEPAVVID
jgi:Fur family transcriptional regulator, zinc uptake regulator